LRWASIQLRWVFLVPLLAILAFLPFMGGATPGIVSFYSFKTENKILHVILWGGFVSALLHVNPTARGVEPV
jgi:hypothetical protein